MNKDPPPALPAREGAVTYKTTERYAHISIFYDEKNI